MAREYMTNSPDTESPGAPGYPIKQHNPPGLGVTEATRRIEEARPETTQQRTVLSPEVEALLQRLETTNESFLSLLSSVLPPQRAVPEGTTPIPPLPAGFPANVLTQEEEEQLRGRGVHICLPRNLINNEVIDIPEGEYEIVTFEMNGIPHQAKLPKSPELKLLWARGIMKRLETDEKDPDKDFRTRQDLALMTGIIGGLFDERYISKYDRPLEGKEVAYAENKDIAKRLYSEYLNRVEFLKVFLSFAYADGSIADTRKTVEQVSGNNLNYLFSIPEFVCALTYYEKHGQDFSKRDLSEPPEAAHKRFQDEASTFVKKVLQRSLEKKDTIFREDDIEIDANIFKADSMREDNIEWARNLAERFWRISARRITQTEGKLTKNEKGKDSFEDTYQKAEYFLSRLLRFKEWLKTGDVPEGLRAYSKLIDNIDFGERDYIEQLIADAPKIEKATAIKVEDGAPEGKMVGININEAVKDGRVNFTKIRWGKREKGSNQPTFDFNQVAGSDNPMEYWLREKLDSPEKARKAMLDTEHPESSFLLKPSTQTLIPLRGAFEYQDDKKFITFATLLSSFIDFLDTSEARKIGILKPDRAMKDTIIAQIGAEFQLTPEESLRIANEKLGTGVIANILLANDYFPADDAFGAFFWEFLKNYVAAISKG